MVPRSTVASFDGSISTEAPRKVANPAVATPTTARPPRFSTDAYDGEWVPAYLHLRRPPHGRSPAWQGKIEGPMWILQTIDSDFEPTTFRLSPGSIKTIGRSTGAELILDAALVSRLHCRLEAHDETLEVVDLDSTNGIAVNGAAKGGWVQVRVDGRADRFVGQATGAGEVSLPGGMR